MRRTLTLQMHARPEGRAFTCPTCDIATMQAADVAAMICPNCSPFLAVAFNENLGPRGAMVATCKWVSTTTRFATWEGAREWQAQTGDPLPPVVMVAIRKHFADRGIPITLEPPATDMHFHRCLCGTTTACAKSACKVTIAPNSGRLSHQTATCEGCRK